MGKIRRGIAAGVLAAVALTGVGGFVARPTAPRPDVEQKREAAVVAQFNEGFADSKQDDCDQGFQPACDWLKEAR
ncbi:hypothetical protein AB0J38_41045 [Streptomyces sp. NPDC050095]|uniref:hypothetical protein n=1 Tax=unclassified Streptomyces TaxID=2593676 RepID=UPI0034242B8A